MRRLRNHYATDMISRYCLEVHIWLELKNFVIRSGLFVKSDEMIVDFMEEDDH